MNDIIKVQIKEHYGNEHIYIVSEQRAFIQQLTGKKTVTRADVEALKGLGFKFEIDLAKASI